MLTAKPWLRLQVRALQVQEFSLFAATTTTAAASSAAAAASSSSATAAAASSSSATAAATAVALATVAALAEAGEEGMAEGLFQTEALSWVILHHFLYQVKQLLVVLTLRHHVMLMGKEGQL